MSGRRRAMACAPLLAKEGMTANPDALEHPQGFFAIYTRARHAEPRPRALGRSVRACRPGHCLQAPSLLRRHASRRRCDSPSARDARAKGAGHRQRSDPGPYPRRLAHTNRPDPKSGLDASSASSYVLARALMHGLLRLEDFSDAAYAMSRRALMAKCMPHPILTRH